LIEEPENGVHPCRLKSIVSYLKKLSQTVVNGKTPQILLSTHSPYLLDYVEAEEVLVFHRSSKDGATAVKRLSEIPDFKKKSTGFLLGEFWTAFEEEALVEGKWDGD
jgi:predicted ATPase